MTEPRQRWSRRPSPTATIVVLVTVIAIIAVLLNGRPNDTAAPAAGVNAAHSHVFKPAVYRSGLAVLHTWRVPAGSRVLIGDVGMYNETNQSVTQGVDVLVSKALASSVRAIGFSPTYDSVVRRDPIVRYRIVRLAPKHHRLIEYRVPLVNPLSSDEFDALVAQQVAEQADYDATRPGAATVAPRAGRGTAGTHVAPTVPGQRRAGGTTATTQPTSRPTTGATSPITAPPVTTTTRPGPLVGDINFDGQVGCSDLLILYNEINQPGSGLRGDLNHDGRVNLFDVSLMTRNWTGDGSLRLDYDQCPF